MKVNSKMVNNNPFHGECMQLIHGQLISSLDVLVRCSPSVSLEWLPTFHDARFEMNLHLGASKLTIRVVESG